MHLPPLRDDPSQPPDPAFELLWSLRRWVFGIRHGEYVEAGIRDVLATVAAPDAADLLFGLMWVVGNGALRKLRIACTCEARVSADEQLLLDVVALYQVARGMEAMALLRTILPPQAALAARDSAAGLAGVLVEAEYWLQPPAFPSMRLAALATGAAGAPLATVH